MAKYRVKVLEVQGINKNVYKAGQVVSEDNFPEGNAEKLANAGHLERITTAAEKKAAEKAEKEAKEAAEKKAAEKAEN